MRPFSSVLLPLAVALRASTARAISLERCTYRTVNMRMGTDELDIAIFDCDFDGDLYLKSRADPDLDPIPSTASRTEVESSIAASGVVSGIPWANFAGVTVSEHEALSNAVFSYSYNAVLGCDHDGIRFEYRQMPSHDAPTNHLYSLPPMKNSINELWKSFGAYKWPDEPVARRMSFGLMVDAGGVTQEDLEICTDNGKLTVSADTMPREDCPDCRFVPNKGGGCSRDECSIWYYSDASGAPIDPTSSVLVERADLQCNPERFANFTSERLPKLYDLLETSTTASESEAAMLSYSTIVNDIDYSACRQVFDSLYTKRSASVFMKGVRGCDDPSNLQDPCCHEAAQWSDCCLPEDKSITVDNVFNATNPDAVNEICGANSATVTSLLDNEISQVLISASHPEFGCNAAYDKLVPKNGDIYKTVWDESPVRECENEVRWGKTKTGSDTCNANEECWSGSCVSDGSSNRCAQLYGEAISGPLLSCVVSRIDPKVWKKMAAILRVDPSKIKKASSFRGPAWSAAVEKFKRIVGKPNCVGDEAERGICAIIDMTKEECNAINHFYEWDRQMEWVTDESNPNGGFCKKRDSSWHEAGIYIHGHTENMQEDCEKVFEAMKGACVDTTMPNGRYFSSSESDCTGANESWFSFEGRSIGGYRLVTQSMWRYSAEEDRWVETLVEGDKEKCILQKECNWDPSNRITGGDEALCLDPRPLESTTYPRASFEDDDGKRMTCLQCWGNHCQDFWAASPPVCAVSPWEQDDCEARSGGGPGNLPPVSAIEVDGHDSHMKCRRDFKTVSECLPSDFCPLPWDTDDHWDEWLHHCAESGCWDLSKNEQSCHYDEATGISFGWRQEYRNGTGACRVEYDHQDDMSYSDNKQFCESNGFMWWEGRAFKPGAFHTADECSTYCDDGSWPLKTTCDTGSCNEHCAQCVASNTWQFPVGAVCHLIDVSLSDCMTLTDYEWDWNAKLCYKKKFDGSETDCVNLDSGGPGYDDDSFSFSMSMDMGTFDFYGDEGGVSSMQLTHQFVSCSAQTESSCSAYCWAKDYDNMDDCYSNELEWDWSLSLCKHPVWRVNQKSSPICESYVAGLGFDASEAERWEHGEQCWTNHCHFEVGSVGVTPPTCTGPPRGCDEQDGETEWVDGGDDASTTGKILLGCRWDLWRSCPTEETCAAAGECEDWFLDDYSGGKGGKCIVPMEPNEWGHRKGCHEMMHPVDGTEFDWADKLGCIAKKSENGMPTFVTEDECSSVGGTWMVRAKSLDECEDNRGNVCTHPFDGWRIFGGIESEEKCDMCSYKTTRPTKWRSGVWSESAEVPLYWVERQYSPKNSWEEHSFDSTAFREFTKRAISRYIADAFKSKVYCELSAYNAFIPTILSLCDSDGQDDEQTTVVKYDLTTSQVSCGNLDEQQPMETYEGSVSFANAKCTNEDDSFAEATMGKVVPVIQNAARRRMESSSVCSQHEVVRNANGALVGQTIGNGLSVSNVNNASVCIRPSVPESAICSQYVEFGISTVDDSLIYSVPLPINATVNEQGEICFGDSQSDVTYVPIMLMSGWESVSGPSPPTSDQTPTASPSIADSGPTPSAPLNSSMVPSAAPSGIPTAPSNIAVGSLEVSFEVAIKLDLGHNITEIISPESLDSVVDFLENIFSSLIPPGGIVRILKIGGYSVARRLLRFLEETDSSSMCDVEFEVILTAECLTASCDNADVVSTALYNGTTSLLNTKCTSGEMSELIRAEAESKGFPAFVNVTVSPDSFQASAATLAVQEANVPSGSPTPITPGSTPEPSFSPTTTSSACGMGYEMVLPFLVASIGTLIF